MKIADFSSMLCHAYGFEFQPYQREILRLLDLTRPREISARRARKLRKRGVSVRFMGWTPTGKCRYVWRRAELVPFGRAR